MELKDKVVIITGGGTGIGRATALKLAAAGAKVVINYSRSEKEAAEVVNEITQKGGAAFAYRANVAIENEVINMVSQTVSTFGKVDGLVNNASITAQIAMDDLVAVTDEVWDSLLNVNVKGMFHCIKAVVPYMKKQQSGVIVNIGSVAGTDRNRLIYPICSNKISNPHNDKVVSYRISTLYQSELYISWCS